MTRTILAALLLAGTATSSALAAPRRVVLFNDGDRQVVRTYYTENYRNGCPPGLVRRGDDCLPRGHARREYVVGRRLGRNVVIAPVPDGLVQRLSPAPYGYRYGMVDGDVVRYDPTTRLVVDAIRALVH
jgi:hypothetical protein